MALIKCPECNREISDKAASCPHCGYPISNTQSQTEINTNFNIVLYGFSAPKIDAVKSLSHSLQISLSESLEFFNSIPCIIKRNIPAQDANRIKNTLDNIKISVALEPCNTSQTEQQILQKHGSDLVRCPRCSSTAITTGARGVNGLFGVIGASKTVNRCAKCGWTWNPSKR